MSQVKCQKSLKLKFMTTLRYHFLLKKNKMISFFLDKKRNKNQVRYSQF